jgi:hypothetical protein
MRARRPGRDGAEPKPGSPELDERAPQLALRAREAVRDVIQQLMTEPELPLGLLERERLEQ